VRTRFVPAGVCDYEGFQACYITDKILTAILRSFPRSYEHTFTIEKDEVVNLLVTKGDKISDTFRFNAPTDILCTETALGLRLSGLDQKHIVTRPSELVAKGHFSPYFQGLVLPDKDAVPDFIISNFSALLGADWEQQAESARVLRSGWTTLATTQTGLQLQHAFFLVKLSYATGMKPYLFMQNKIYQGVYLRTKNVNIFTRKGVLEPLSRLSVIEELKEFNSHDEALTELSRYLSDLTLEGGESIVVDSTLLTSPRAIHNLLRGFKLTNDERQDIRKFFKRLSFPNTLYEPRSPVDLIKVFRKASAAEFFEDEVPMRISDEAMFTKDPISSCFASFGAVAPSFYDSLGTPTPIVSNNKTNQEKYGKDQIFLHLRKVKGSLAIPDGRLPVFVKPTQQAIQDFNTMRSAHCVSFRLTPRGGVAGTSFLVDKGHTESVSKMLIACFAPRKGGDDKSVKKRGLGDLDGDEISKESIRRKKRRAEGSTGLWSFSDMQHDLPGPSSLREEDESAPLVLPGDGDDEADADENEMDLE
jgi:hypothetical protein